MTPEFAKHSMERKLPVCKMNREGITASNGLIVKLEYNANRGLHLAFVKWARGRKRPVYEWENVEELELQQEDIPKNKTPTVGKGKRRLVLNGELPEPSPERLVDWAKKRMKHGSSDGHGAVLEQIVMRLAAEIDRLKGEDKK